MQDLPDKPLIAMTGACARPRTRSSVTIRHLPSELLVQILNGIHICDLLSVRQVCRHFYDATGIPSLWKNASFFKSWPCTDVNLQIFLKAASCDNFEAVVKLAFARLYNERLPQEEQQLSLDENAWQAAEYFCQAEQLSASTFSWIFLRPPWAIQSPSCKYFVFKSMIARAEKETSQNSKGSVAMCVGLTMDLMESGNDGTTYIEQAAQKGLPEAQLYQWLQKYTRESSLEKCVEYSRQLEAIRQLRFMANQNQDIDTQLHLCKYYLRGQHWGVSWQQARAFTNHLFQSSRPLEVLPVLSPPHTLNTSMRYILVDWLAEVSTNLNLSTQVLLNTVAIVDRCLLVRPFLRGEIQLMGVSALLISSRCMASEILTIREAAWYTDNTYSYEDVVEMMGEIVGILRGNIKQVTCGDYTWALQPVCGLTERGMYLLDYIAELCLLHADMTAYSPAKIAASSVLLARVMMNFAVAWSPKLEEATGFSCQDLVSCVMSLHKCLVEDVRFDSQNSPMQAVKLRFTGEQSLHDLSQFKPPSDKQLQDMLGVASPVELITQTKFQLRRAQELICSPSRGKRRSRSKSTGEAANYDHVDSFNESFCSYTSDDCDRDPRTDSFGEWSDADNGSSDLSSSSPPSFISGCSQLALSSPYSIKINISNFSISTSSSSSGIGSTFSSSSHSQSDSSSESDVESLSDLAVPDHLLEDIDDNISLGFSCADDLSEDEDVDDIGRDLDQTFEGPCSASLPYSVETSSACVCDDIGNLNISFEIENDDYGVLNQAFCEQDLDEVSEDNPCPPSSSSPQDHDCQKKLSNSAIANNSELCKTSSCNDCVQAEVMLDDGKTSMQQSCPVFSDPPSSVHMTITGARLGSSDSVKKDMYPQTSQFNSESSANADEKQEKENDAKETYRSPTFFVPLVKDIGPQGVVGRRVSPRINRGGSLAYPVAESNPCSQPEQVVDRDNSATCRRKSLRSSARMSLRFLGSSSPSDKQYSNSEDKGALVLDRTVAYVKQAARAHCSSAHQEDEVDLVTATKRKSPRTPAQILSPSVLKTKRQRRSSGNQKM